MAAAIRDPDPVVFLEPKRIYRAVREEVADDGVAAALDRCEVLREGADVTIVAWGAMCVECLAAAETLAADGVEAEVVDEAIETRPDDEFRETPPPYDISAIDFDRLVEPLKSIFANRAIVAE